MLIDLSYKTPRKKRSEQGNLISVNEGLNLNQSGSFYLREPLPRIREISELAGGMREKYVGKEYLLSSATLAVEKA